MSHTALLNQQNNGFNSHLSGLKIYSKQNGEQLSKNRLSTWIWPVIPSQFVGPRKYSNRNLDQIPTGSIYLACRNGLQSEISNQITGCPYDSIGIVFQSTIKNKQGTYVYLIDEKGIIVKSLKTMMDDSQILSHSVLPLRPGKLIEPTNDDNDSPILNVESDDFMIERVEILKKLFQKYRKYQPDYDEHQQLIGLVGIQCSDGVKDGNPVQRLTPAELVGRILFEAGLIWSDGFNTDGQNPAEHLDRELFRKLIDLTSDSVAEIKITTPDPVIKSIKISNSVDSVYLTQSLSNSSELIIEPQFFINSDERNNSFRLEDSVSSLLQCSETDNQPSSKDIKPKNRVVRSHMVDFKTLRPVDFLIDYYDQIGLSIPENPISVNPKVNQIVQVLNHMSRDSDRVPLNLSWFHDRLIPIQQNGSNDIKPNETNCDNLLSKLNNTLSQARSLQNKDLITDYRIYQLCEDITLLAGNLHQLAVDTKARVHFIQEGTSRYKVNVEDCETNSEEIAFCLRLDQPPTEDIEYKIQLYPYMRRLDWKFVWLKYSSYPNSYLNSATELVNSFKELKYKTPQSCILIEIIYHLYFQAQRIKGYLQRSMVRG